jgi:glucosamine-6-phosphate deaminase
MTQALSSESLELTVTDSKEIARRVAREIAAIVNEKRRAGRTAVLGLATGSTPLDVYGELVGMYRRDTLSFSNVVTFNLDEFLGLPRSYPQTFRRFMQDVLFDHVDIPPENIHIPDVELHEAQIDTHCRDYERAIQRVGGIDLLLLGLGVNGHVGFNEPGSEADSRTRAVELAPSTREGASRWFGGLENVPKRAITMGVGTILEARSIRLIATGERKSEVLARLLASGPNAELPATFLRGHPDAMLYADPAAAGRE